MLKKTIYWVFFFTGALSKHTVCIWNGKIIYSDNKQPLWLIQFLIMLSWQWSCLCNRWRLKARSETESMENKSAPHSNSGASSRYDESLAEFSVTISNPPFFAPPDTLSLPSPSLRFTSTNESFHLPLKCHSQRANTQLPIFTFSWVEDQDLYLTVDFQHSGMFDTSHCKGSKDESTRLLWQRRCTLTTTEVWCV